MQKIVDRINASFSVHALWNGYRIRMFRRKNLVISGSQNWTYYRNLDVIFKKVIFFNLPPEWHDTWIRGEDLFRLSTVAEFRQHHPDFDPLDRHVFAIDLTYSGTQRTFFILASNVFCVRCESPDNDGDIYYEDPLGEAAFWSGENRVM
ncbi:MAG: hypothetical protein H6581_16985 [Bacteroidia bacterium]|nr:hypothetical protein [Bacteroidia bacterium]